MTAQSEGAAALTRAISTMVLEVAAAPSGARMLLVSCQRCRNHLLYVLDTVPYSDRAAQTIRARLHALGQVHTRHDDPEGPDRAVPKIRGLA